MSEDSSVVLCILQEEHKDFHADYNLSFGLCSELHCYRSKFCLSTKGGTFGSVITLFIKTHRCNLCQLDANTEVLSLYQGKYFSEQSQPRDRNWGI